MRMLTLMERKWNWNYILLSLLFLDWQLFINVLIDLAIRLNGWWIAVTRAVTLTPSTAFQVWCAALKPVSITTTATSSLSITSSHHHRFALWRLSAITAKSSPTWAAFVASSKNVSLNCDRNAPYPPQMYPQITAVSFSPVEMVPTFWLVHVHSLVQILNFTMILVCHLSMAAQENAKPNRTDATNLRIWFSPNMLTEKKPVMVAFYTKVGSIHKTRPVIFAELFSRYHPLSHRLDLSLSLYHLLMLTFYHQPMYQRDLVVSFKQALMAPTY